VVKIYEACNFQDLGGQRIGHAIVTLNMIEDRVAGMLDRCKVLPGNMHAAKQAPAQKLINGPRLDGASGHTNQHDIDALFG
jgi:chemotaxis protein CheZ